jgi:hypothetical protein
MRAFTEAISGSSGGGVQEPPPPAVPLVAPAPPLAPTPLPGPLGPLGPLAPVPGGHCVVVEAVVVPSSPESSQPAANPAAPATSSADTPIADEKKMDLGLCEARSRSLIMFSFLPQQGDAPASLSQQSVERAIGYVKRSKISGQSGSVTDGRAPASRSTRT